MLVAEGVRVAVKVAVFVEVSVGVGMNEGVIVNVEVGESVRVAVRDGVGVLVAGLGVFVAVGHAGEFEEDTPVGVGDASPVAVTSGVISAIVVGEVITRVDIDAGTVEVRVPE